MATLLHQRCFNHATREAAARCPECSRFFCRECITEHDDRVICTACLKKFIRVPLLKRPFFTAIFRVTQGLAGLFLAWFFFYLIGNALVGMPTSFHEGEMWQVKWTDKE